ncbi:cold shock domain-containing protein [Corynebacterium callunae]|uniref:cold-shock protein n=1 Tax=Corynebacterium callunae TaxID=1721 RepID=UPI003981C9D2
MPVGTVKWYDAERGFGFVSNPDGDDCYVGKQVLPKGIGELHKGQRIDFDFAAGRKGPQALRVKVLETPRRKPQHKYEPDALHGMISDVITLLESSIQPGLAKGHYPENKAGAQVAKILRVVANELDA